MLKKTHILLSFSLTILILVGCGKKDSPVETNGSPNEVPAPSTESQVQEVTMSRLDSNLAAYKNVLDLYYQAYLEQQDHDFYYEHDLETIMAYPYLLDKPENALELGSFAFMDLDGDDSDELLLGWVQNEFCSMEDGYVFLIYTIRNGEPALAICGWERCRFVIGADGFIYNEGSSGAAYTDYVKYRCTDDCRLVAVEEIYSQDDAVSGDFEIWWEHITNPADIGVIEYTQKHEDLLIDGDDAIKLGDSWMNSGLKPDYMTFSSYEYHP